jgi:signal peptidase I
VLTALCLGACESITRGPGGFDGYESAILAPSAVTPDAFKTGTAVSQLGLPGSMLLRGVGVSMQPIIGEGTIIVVEPTKWEDLKEADIVVYRTPVGKLVAHRLIRLEGDHWIIKGDNNDIIDPYTVTRENLVGVAVNYFYPPENSESN